MPWYEDQPTVQVHCHQEAGKLSLPSDRLWKISRNLIGSQESVFLEIMKKTVQPLIPESALELEDIRMTPSLVEIMQ